MKTQPELVWYHHAAAGFPTKPTFLAAIKNKQFPSWPGLTVDAVRKHFPESEETHKGHGRKIPSGLRSKKPKSLPNQSSFFLTGEECSILDKDSNERWEESMRTVRLLSKERTVYYEIHDYDEFTKQSKVWTDQTGRLPKKSSRGNQYVMVLAESNSDAILAEPMKNRTSGEMIRAYQVLID